ncbi:MAG: molybdopterin-dependent oxidoreductase [Anaerovoracaceae bacterium]
MDRIAEKYADMLLTKEFEENTLFSPYHWEEGGVPSKETKTLFGLCRHCMQGDCHTLVHLEEGVVVKVEGRDGVPPNYGSLCLRGNAAIMNLYNPYRAKVPMMRTNPTKDLNVDPRWKEITWEEALDITARELKKVRDEDPRGLAICEGWGQRDTILRVPFRQAFGTPNEIGSHGALCTVHYATGLVQGNFPVSVVDLEYCNYHITIGRSVGPNFATTGGTRKFAKAMDRGMKLVCVDPRCSYEATKGEWVPIRPGSDYAFMLAMAHTMMYELETYDEEFLIKRTNCAYLIDEGGDYLRHGESGKPLVWDTKTDSAVPFDTKGIAPLLEGRRVVDGKNIPTGFTKIKEEFLKYTPEWAQAITDVPAGTTRRIAREFVEHAQIGSTIEIDGFTFPFRPVSLNAERNLTNHRGGTYADLTGKLINMMVGAMEVPGSCLGSGYRGPSAIPPTEDGTAKPGYEAVPKPFTFPPNTVGMEEFFPHCHTTPHLAANAILDPEKYYLDYDIKAWFTIGGNPIRMDADPDKFVRMFQKIPFHVAVSYHMDEVSLLADVILPEHSFMERERVAVFYPQHQCHDNEVFGLQMIQMRQAVDPLFNTMHCDDILTELADRIGILTGEGGLYDHLNKGEDYIIREHGLNIRDPYRLDIDKRHTLREIFDAQIRSWKYGNGEGFEELSKTGYMVHWEPRKKSYLYYYYPDDQTKHQFYFINLKEVGDQLRADMKKHGVHFPELDDDEYIFELYEPIPHWVETSEMNAPAEYDMWAINWKTPYVSSDVGAAVSNPWLAELYKSDPFEAVICINADTAKKKKLKDGDKVKVSSRYGEIDGILRTSQRFQPETIGVAGSYGKGGKGANPLHNRGPHFNRLLSTKMSTLDGISAGQDIAPKVKIEKRKKEKRRMFL